MLVEDSGKIREDAAAEVIRGVFVPFGGCHLLHEAPGGVEREGVPQLAGLLDADLLAGPAEDRGHLPVPRTEHRMASFVEQYLQPAPPEEPGVAVGQHHVRLRAPSSRRVRKGSVRRNVHYDAGRPVGPICALQIAPKRGTV